MRQRIYEAFAGTIAASKPDESIRVCLISEGSGSSAEFPRSFFTQENADALAGSLSFPAHPMDLTQPHQRDPLSAIGQIGESVTVEEHDGKIGFWSEYHPAKSKPQIAEYLREFGPKLGLSIYADSDGHTDSSTGKWVAESLDGSDPYKSVDLVVAAGRGGKFEKVAESLGLLPKTTATAEEKEVTHMDKDIEKRFDDMTKLVEGLALKLDGKAKADAQIVADTEAVEKLAEARIENYDKAAVLIESAKLTESQSASLRAKAKTGADITSDLEDAKKVLAEALATVDPEGNHRIVEAHLGDSDGKTGTWDPRPANFGKARVS
jgi:hypothetical protein